MTLFIVINKVIKFRTHHQILWQLVDIFIQMAITDEKDWSQEKFILWWHARYELIQSSVRICQQDHSSGASPI